MRCSPCGNILPASQSQLGGTESQWNSVLGGKLKQLLASLVSNTQVMPEVWLLWLEVQDIADQARPGQFYMARCGEGSFLRRPLSVHQVSGRLALLVKVVGQGTRWLAQRQPGENIDLIGPLGNGFSIPPEASNLLLVAGGMGIAPLVFLAQVALQERRSVTLLLGAKTKEQVYPRRLLPPGVNLVVATEDGSEGKRGLATDFIGELASQADQVLACGPIAMYKAMRKALGSYDKPVQVSLEAWMGCGLGACYACTTLTRQGPRQVCREGPVFELDDILWDEI